MRLYQEKLQYQHDRAAADSDLKQICAEPCGGCAMTLSRRDFPARDNRATNTDAGKQA